MSLRGEYEYDAAGNLTKSIAYDTYWNVVIWREEYEYEPILGKVMREIQYDLEISAGYSTETEATYTFFYIGEAP